MILQALKEYYERKAADPDSDIAPEGWEYKAIQYIFVIDAQGNLVQIEDTQEGDGKYKKAKVFLVPRAEIRTGNIKSNLLWDKAEYIFAGVDVKKDSHKLMNQRIAFRSKLNEQLGEFDCIQTLILLLEKITTQRLQQEYCWDEIKKNNPNITFRLKGDSELLVNRQDIMGKVRTILDNQAGKKGNKDIAGVCLLSGDLGIIKLTHSKTPINRKNNSLISFQKKCGYDSYGKMQGLNAPISKKSEFGYVTALNTLLKSERQRFYVGDATYVCWSADKTNFETEFMYLFSDSERKDNPDSYSENIKTLLQSIYSGAYIEHEGNQRFYILGLSPGGGTRISVRFWDTRTIAEYAENIRQYFDEMSICKPPNYHEHFSIGRLLVSVAPQGDKDNIPPKLAGEMVHSIMSGLPYPESVLQAAIRRTRSGIQKKSQEGAKVIERVTPEIAALLKAYLNRYYRFQRNESYKEVNMELDKNQPSVGYQLGRLFASLERIQTKQNPKLNTTIRERYYGAACATPITVFPTLLRLSNYHLAKLDKGNAVYFEKLLGEIIGKLNDFPSYMNLHEQGLFAIGYYHQRQAFVSPKKD